jgi:hypothetical protein
MNAVDRPREIESHAVTMSFRGNLYEALMVGLVRGHV